MNGKLSFLLAFTILGVASAAITIDGVFKDGFGWKITCTWTAENEKQHIDNVTISRNNVEIIKYNTTVHDKPYTGKATTSDYVINYTCNNYVKENKKTQGKCEIDVEILTAAGAGDEYDLYKARIGYTEGTTSGLMPVDKEYEKFVMDKASVPHIENLRKKGEKPLLNCTSEGVPSPKLFFTVGNSNITAAAEVNSYWNTKSKRWLSTAVYNVTSDKQEYPIICHAYQHLQNGTNTTESTDSFKNSAGKLSSPFYLAVALMVTAITSQIRL